LSHIFEKQLLLKPNTSVHVQLFGMTKMNVESFENIFSGDGLMNEAHKKICVPIYFKVLI
jgi:hypothetical protein